VSLTAGNLVFQCEEYKAIDQNVQKFVHRAKKSSKQLANDMLAAFESAGGNERPVTTAERAVLACDIAHTIRVRTLRAISSIHS
jgi:glucokinase